jgi:hypothetical protein
MSDWTSQRVEQMAPDAASIAAARGVAKPGKWSNLGRDGNLVWGECQGSGKTPYQVRVDHVDAAYKCSCPSRKLPCKHTLGLLLMFVDGHTPEGAPLAFVEEWAANRAKRAETKQKKEEAAPVAPDPVAKAKRVEKRESRVGAGLDQLETWLADIVGQGLATARAQPPAFWTQMAARLVDAQAPGLARRVGELGDRALSEAQWQPRLLRALAELQLVIDAWRNVERLPAPLAAELRMIIGFSQSQDELRERAGVRDEWQVIGRRQTQEDKLRVQSTWLHGARTGSIALILEFAAGSAPIAATYTLGQVLDAELAFFDGTPQLRAIEKQRHGSGGRRLVLPPPIDIVGMQSNYAAMLAQNPWLGARPFVLGPVEPVLIGEKLHLEDASRRRIAVHEQCVHQWHLLALAGGAPVTILGEWDGATFDPLTIERADAWYTRAQLNALPLLSRVA